MKRFGLIAAGAVTLGLSALTPSFAKADGFHDNGRHDRDDKAHVQVHVDFHDDHRDGRWNDRDRWDHDRDRVVVVRPVPVYVPSPPPIVVYAPPPVYVQPNVDYTIAICDVPQAVMQSAESERYGAAIESVQFVRRNGEEFYRFDLLASYGRHLDMRIRPNGKVLGIDPC